MQIRIGLFIMAFVFAIDCTIAKPPVPLMSAPNGDLADATAPAQTNMNSKTKKKNSAVKLASVDDTGAPSPAPIPPLDSGKPDTSYGRYQNDPISLGVELGFLGRQDSINNDFLGMQAFWGGRIFFDIPIVDRLSLKPSLGFFYRQQSTYPLTTYDKDFEGGVGLFYTVIKNEPVRFQLGAVQRIDLESYSMSYYSSNSTNSPVQYFYRLGPGASLSVHVTPGVSILGDFDYTWQLTSPTRGYSSATAGIGFDF